MHTTLIFRDVQMQTILLGIAVTSAVCWWLLVVAMPADGAAICGANGVGSTVSAWSMARMLSLCAMWSIMAPAMMLPAATLAILLASWERRGNRMVYAIATSFAAGYLLIALPGSVLAALVQWVLESTGIVISTTAMADPLLSGLVLVAAGLHQVSLLRSAVPQLCSISSCGNIDGHAAMNKGFEHGRSRFGCCIGMICLQFAGGAMNIGWMAFLAAWMTADALLPWKRPVGLLAGTVLLVTGGLCLGSRL